MSRNLVEDTLFNKMIQHIKLEEKPKKKQECNWQLKETIFEKQDDFKKYGYEVT